MKGKLIIISSPSGGGKGTLIRELLQAVPDIGYSVSSTTRAPRFGEDDGKHYNFITREEFEQAVEQGEFLEYAEVHGNMYGTSLAQTEKMTDAGLDVVLEIDVQGATKVRERMPDAIGIFILPPSFEVLKARLTARATEGDDDLQLRLHNSLGEVMQYEHFDYLVVNDEVQAASRKLAAIVIAERQHRDRQNQAVQGILDSFVKAKL